MTSLDFQIPRHVSEFPTTQLFFNRFPYKVVAHVWPARNYRSSEWLFHHELRDRNERRLKKHLPPDEKTWKIISSGPQNFYYFSNISDAEALINGGKRLIEKFYRPHSEDELKALQEIDGAQIKQRLFLNHYKYCIRFKYLFREDRELLDNWVESMLSGQPDRAAYSHTEQRRLYLNYEPDIFMTRIGFGSLFSQVLTAVLRSNLIESDSSPKTD